MESLSPHELARQLANPKGPVGLEVMKWIDAANRPADQRLVASLELAAGHRVLEIGCGTGRTAATILELARNIEYVGLDLSPAMIAEAQYVNGRSVADGHASFHCGMAQALPFATGNFDRVFSIGVAHFWADPVEPLREVRRVLRSGGLSVMGCLHPDTVPDFAQPENGVYVRDANEWHKLYQEAGFVQILVETVESTHRNPDGSSIRRTVFDLKARA
jgi:ubiquinone/menaquinone biosynthesis C-methylase UbiE